MKGTKKTGKMSEVRVLHAAGGGFSRSSSQNSRYNKNSNSAAALKAKNSSSLAAGKFVWMKWRDAIPDFYIDDDLYDKMVFRETLLVSTLGENGEVPSPIGGLCLDIQSAKGNPFNRKDSITRQEFKARKFLVHLSSQLDFKNGNGGSTITSWVDRQLHTLEEQRTEFLHSNYQRLDQTLYLNTQDNSYYLRHNKHKEIVYNPTAGALNLVCEGANLLLMRYLAIKRFVGSFEILTTYINGDLCRNVYTCEGPSGGIVNDTKLDVCKIYRTITEECGIIHESVTLMTLQGQILKQEWFNCNVILQINPLANISNDKPAGHLSLKTDYKRDIELLSRYLDAKTLSEKTIHNYMDDCQQIKNLIADYVDTILLLKPENILDYTAEYFLSFSPDLIPKSEYFKKRDENDDGEENSDMNYDEFYV